MCVVIGEQSLESGVDGIHVCVLRLLKVDIRQHSPEYGRERNGAIDFASAHLRLVVVQVSISFSTEIVLSSERRSPKYNSTKRAEEASLSLCSIQKSTSFFSSSRVNAKRIAARMRNATQKVALRKEIAALEAERVALQRLLPRLAERYAVRHEEKKKL